MPRTTKRVAQSKATKSSPAQAENHVESPAAALQEVSTNAQPRRAKRGIEDTSQAGHTDTTTTSKALTRRSTEAALAAASADAAKSTKQPHDAQPVAKRQKVQAGSATEVAVRSTQSAREDRGQEVMQAIDEKFNSLMRKLARVEQKTDQSVVNSADAVVSHGDLDIDTSTFEETAEAVLGKLDRVEIMLTNISSTQAGNFVTLLDKMEALEERLCDKIDDVDRHVRNRASQNIHVNYRY